MVTKHLLRALVITFSFVGMGFAQDAWKFPDFSATQVFEGRKTQITMKVYFSSQNLRVERTAAISTLYANESATVYKLTSYPDNSHQCVSMKPEQARMMPSPMELIQGKIVKRVAAGTEVVDGHPTNIEDVSVVGIDGKTIESRVWEAEDLQGIPVKIESHLKTITLSAIYRDIVIGTPQKSLFEVPSKCTPYETMWQVAEEKF